MSNKSDESSEFMSYVVAIIVGCALIAKCITRDGEWLSSAGDAAISLFTTLGWLLLLAGIGCVAYWSLDYITMFVKSDDHGTDIEKSFEHRPQEISNYAETSAQKKYEVMEWRLRKMEDELKQTLKKTSEVPDFQPVTEPLVVSHTPDQSEWYDVYEEDLVEEDDEPRELSPY